MVMKFYKCAHCGKMIAVVKDTPVPVMCCGEKMQEIIPGSTDAAQEKHVPVFEVKDGVLNVTVGSVEHPMTPEHYIEWIAVQTTEGCKRKILTPDMPPKASFALLDGEKVEAVCAFCNLHSLWKA